MAKRRLFFLFAMIFCTAGNSSSAVEVKQCCLDPSMQVVENYELAVHTCQDPITNRTSNLTLSCKGDVFRNMTFVTFSVDDQGQLNIKAVKKMFDMDPQEPGTFCISNEVENGSQVQVAVLCWSEADYLDRMYDTDLVSIAMLVSVPFLLLTALVYCLVPELRDVQGKSIICLCVSFAGGLALMALMGLMSYSDMNMCAARGFTVYFCIIASFFWMNAISIQVFRSVRFRNNQVADSNEFLWYSLYAWGGPGVLTVCVLAANYIPGDHMVPGIGLNTCWFYRSREQWAYFYSPMLVLILINVCLFVYTSLLLWRHSFSSSNIKVLRYKFSMCLQLLVVMGISWVFELASSAHGRYHKFWVVMDVYNCLQGILIFIVVVVLRKRALRGLLRHGLCCCLTGCVQRHLESGDEEDHDLVDHTTVVPLNEKP